MGHCPQLLTLIQVPLSMLVRSLANLISHRLQGISQPVEQRDSGGRIHGDSTMHGVQHEHDVALTFRSRCKVLSMETFLPVSSTASSSSSSELSFMPVSSPAGMIPKCCCLKAARYPSDPVTLLETMLACSSSYIFLVSSTRRS